jgi:ethanolamine utilization protein EutN
MDLARVVGTVVATERDPLLGSYRLAVVQLLDDAGAPKGDPQVAIDALNRREGDLVFLVRSGDAMYAHWQKGDVPTDLAIGGLVEEPRR